MPCECGSHPLAYHVTHDHGLYQRVSAPMPDPGLQPAIELWVHVISVPQPGWVVVGTGRRECPDDSGAPVLLRAFRAGTPLSVGESTLDRMFDHHAVFQTSGTAPQIGDVVVMGISHPCSAFSRWRTLPPLDDHHIITQIVHSYV